MDGSIRGAVAAPLVRYGLLYPLTTLVGLFLAAELVGVAYGDLVFLLSLPAAAAWVVAGLAGRWLATRLPAFELLFGAPGSSPADPDDSTDGLSPGGALLVYLTGLVALGWTSLVAIFVLFG